MTTTEKVRLVDHHRNDRGLNRCLRIVGFPKITYYYRQMRSNEPSEEEQKLMNCIRDMIQAGLTREGRHSSIGYVPSPEHLKNALYLESDLRITAVR